MENFLFYETATCTHELSQFILISIITHLIAYVQFTYLFVLLQVRFVSNRLAKLSVPCTVVLFVVLFEMLLPSYACDNCQDVKPHVG